MFGSIQLQQEQSRAAACARLVVLATGEAGARTGTEGCAVAVLRIRIPEEHPDWQPHAKGGPGRAEGD